MEKFEEVKGVRILPLDESMFNHSIDNIHYNSIGSFCELRLDSVLEDKLNKLLGTEGVCIESDFSFTVKDGEVNSMKMTFGMREYLTNNLFETDKKDFYLEGLTKVLKEVFETDDVSLEMKDGVSFVYWVMNDKSRMLWLIENLNRLGISTKGTFEII